MPGQAELDAAGARRRRVTTPRFSAIERQLAQAAPGRFERRPSRAAAPEAGAGVGGAGGHGPIGHEGAEVVDPADVVQLARPPEPLDPPVVTAAPQSRPVVQRVAPQLAEVGELVRRRPRHQLMLEQLGVGLVVGAAGRHVDRHVADQPHAALLRVGAQRTPLAVEADLVGHRVVPGEPLPIPDPVGLARPELRPLAVAHGRVPLRQQPGRRRERRRRLVRRAPLARRPQREHLPPRLAGRREPVHEPVGLVAEAAARKRGRVELDSGGAWQA